MASFRPEQQWAELQRRLGLKDELTPTAMTILGGLLTIVLVSWIIRSFRAFPTSDHDVPPKLTTRPKDLKQLNGSVWEFHKPHDRVQNMEIIFFHGAQLSSDKEAFWKTWLSRDETIVWPKVWLAEAFPDARILSISYDSSVRKCHGQKDMYQAIENLMHDIVWSSTCKAGQKCPVIFAGHCFGGIIIKAFLLKCHDELKLGDPRNLQAEEMKTFLQNCKAVFYYSTPHGGARFMDGLAYTDCILGSINQPLVKFLEILNTETSRINGQFSRLRDRFNPRLTTRAIGEKLETKLKGFTKTILVVPEASARQDVDHIYWADADHFDVARAKDNSACFTFTGLKDLIDDVQCNRTFPFVPIEFKSALTFSNDEPYVPLGKTISEIDSAFKESQVVVLHGDSGMGKSSLARHYALRFEREHAQGVSSIASGPSQSSRGPAVVFVPCGKGAKITSTQKVLLSKFGADYPREEWKELDDAHFQELVLDQLKDHIGDREALVVLDDVWKRELVENVLIPGPKLKYFITTRDRNLWGQNAIVIEIQPADMEHGRRILANYAKGENHYLFKGQADELIEQVGFHPLALATLGTVLRFKKRQSVREWQELKRDFLEYLKSDSDSYHPIIFSKSYPRSLHAAMMLMMDELDEASKTVLFTINFFEFEWIPESLVELFLSSTHPDVYKSFCVNIEKLESLSLVRRETQTAESWDFPELPFSEDGNENEDEVIINSFEQITHDVFFVHDLRRTFLSEDNRSTSRITNFLYVDRESFPSDRNTRSKYDLATFLCLAYGQDCVREMARTRLPNLKLFLPARGSDCRDLIAKLVCSVREQSSNSIAAIEVFWTFLVHRKIDLHDVPVLLMKPESNRRTIELVYIIFRLFEAGLKPIVIDTGDSLERFERSTLTEENSESVLVNIGGSLDRFTHFLSSNGGVKSVVVLSVFRFLLYATRYPDRVLIPDFMNRIVATDLLDMIFLILDRMDRHKHSWFLSLRILRAFIQRNARSLSGPALLTFVAKITCPNNLDVIVRLLIEDRKKMSSDVEAETRCLVRSITELISWLPSDVTKTLVKNFIANPLQTTTLLEMVLRWYFWEEYDEDKKGQDEDNQEEQAYVSNDVNEFIIFAAMELSGLLGSAVMRFWQEMKNRGKFAFLIAELAQLPGVPSKIINDDLQVGCLDKLVEMLDDKRKKKLQVQILKTLCNLAKDDTYDPGNKVQVKMLETEHLLERTIMFLSDGPDMERRCRWAAFLLMSLIPIRGPHVEPLLQGPIFVSLLGKARHFNTCLERVTMLLREDVKWDLQKIGLKVLLSIARLAFIFTRSGNNLIDESAISDLLGRVVTLLVPDVENIRENAVEALAILAQFRFDERLGLEEHMRRLVSPKLLEKLATMLSKVNVSNVLDSGTAVRIIGVLANVPAMGELIVEFRSEDGPMIEKLLGLVYCNQNLPVEIWPFTISGAAVASVEALTRLPARDEIEARIQSLDMATLSYLYSRWGWANVVRKDYEAALKDLNRALELRPDHGHAHGYYLLERGIVRRYLNDLNGALGDLNQALEIYGNDYACLKNRGLIQYKLGDEEGARKDAEGAITFLQEGIDVDVDLDVVSFPHGEYYRVPCLGFESVEFLEYRLK